MVSSVTTHIKRWYAKFERPISSLSLIGGFVFDAVTLTRVDEFWENVWVGVHLLIVATCIVLINLRENKTGDEAKMDPGTLHFWLVNALQWFFGGLLSTYLVFYFRSGILSISWPFFIILAAAFIANERLKHHYARLTFQISILFLSIFLFSAYIVPVLFRAIGPWVFIASGVISLVVVGLFLLILHISARERFKESRLPLMLSIGGIFIAMNILYFLNIIPPLPISLKDADIYQSFAVDAPGYYTAQYEPQGFWGFLQLSETIHLTPDGTLYAYSAIFSPASFNVNVIHEWQYYSTSTRAWITRGRITLPTVGGSDNGYRTFSMEEQITPGAWRVNVKTPQGQIIGRMNFTVVATDTLPALQTLEIH